MAIFPYQRAVSLLACAVALTTISAAGARFARGGEGIVNFISDPRAFLPNYASVDAPLRHWRQFPVKVLFLGDARCGQQDLKKVVTDGFDQWVSASGGAVRYSITTDPNDADITVRFRRIDRAPGTGSRVGTTQVKYIGSRATSANMELMLWDGMTSREINQGLRTTAAHEFGHALGVIDHSSDPKDLMYRAHRCDVSIPISARDINTLKSHYAWMFTAPRRTAPAVASTPSAVTTARSRR